MKLASTLKLRFAIGGAFALLLILGSSASGQDATESDEAGAATAAEGEAAPAAEGEPTMGAGGEAGPVTAPAAVAEPEKPWIVEAFESFVGVFMGIVFLPVGIFPLVVWVLILGSIFYTFRMKLINLFGFAHAIQITRGKFDDPDDPGEISHFQALTSALSATVGLGNIAGVAVAVGTGGAGAVFWMVAIAFFGMTAKFVECTLAQVWRKVDEDGVVSGGPMYYLSIGLAEKGMGTFGKILAFIFAVSIIGGAFGGGNMFQANQSYELAASQIPFLASNALLYGLILASLVAVVILGGIKRIGAATSKIVPFMAGIYIVTSLAIIFMNIDRLPAVIGSIFTEAFSAQAFYGGTLGVIITGIQRAVFSNEAGIGSAAIAHSAAKTKEPVREGMVAMLGPFIDTVVICVMTASVLLITAPDNKPLQELTAAIQQKHIASEALAAATTDDAKAFAQNAVDQANLQFKAKRKGAVLTSAAFETNFSWFPAILSLVVFLFAYSTMISWCYYGEKGWVYLFGRRTITVYRVLFLGAVVLGSVASLGPVIDFSDTMIFLCAFPNIIGGVLLSGVVREKLDDYWTRYQQGEFKAYK